MPKFNKTLEQLRTRYEKWLYLLRHLDRLTDIPEKFQDKIFKKLFKAAEISRFNPEEADAYEDSLKIYRDIVNSIDYAHELGRIEAKLETAGKMLARGMEVDLISEITGLTKKEIESQL